MGRNIELHFHVNDPDKQSTDSPQERSTQSGGDVCKNTRCWTENDPSWHLKAVKGDVGTGGQAKQKQQDRVHLEVTLHIKVIPSIIQASDGGWKDNGKKSPLKVLKTEQNP